MNRIVLLLLFAFASMAQAQTNQIDSKGRKQGKWIKYDHQNFLQYTGSFKDDVPQGTFRYYYPYKDTAIKSIMVFKNSGKEAYATNFHLNGKIMAKGKYLNQKKDSVWHFYDEEGYSISTDTYKDDKKNGMSKVFYPSGKIYSEYNYKNDKKDGTFKEYFEDGSTKAEGTYFEGDPDGKCTYYFPTGKIAATGLYKKGLKHLIWNYNKSDGKPEPREVYNMGKLLEGKAADEFLKKQSAQKPNKPTNTTKKPTPTTTTKPAPKKPAGGK